MIRRRSIHCFAFVIAASLFLPGAALAQVSAAAQLSTAKYDTSGPTLTAYANGVRTAAAKRELQLSNLDVSVEVRGDIAETTVTATFMNPGNELLEGQFALNMTRGAVVTGYALDIGGTLVDGVIETKYKAAEAYQRRVTQRIDPGLAEVDYSDRFETRIYPINPRGSRTIRLRMTSQFDPAEGYMLPLTLPKEVGQFKLTIDGDARIVAVPKGLGTPATRMEAEKVKLDGALRLAAGDRAQPMLVSEHPGAERFFDLLAPAPRGNRADRAPLHVFWDRSVSRSDDALKTEAQLAEDFAAGQGLRTVKVTLFDSGRIDTEEVPVGQLAERLGGVRYRGGTSYAGLSGVAVTPGADCLMFSDGRVSIDERRDFALKCRVSAVTSGPESDRAWLNDLVQRSGGSFIELARTDSKAAMAQLARPEAGIIAMTDASGEPVEFVRLPARAGMVHLVGPLPSDGVVMLQMAGETTQRRFAAPVRANFFAGPGALWASQRLGVLGSELPPDELAGMARRYNVATPQASFVVLETPNDYVQARIEPPASYPKALRQQYIALRESADRTDQQKRDRRLDLVAGLWERQKEWWGTKFDGREKKEDAKTYANGGAGSGARDRAEFSGGPPREMPRPAPASPPPPSPVSPPPAGELAQDRVVVTGSSRIANLADEDGVRQVGLVATDQRAAAASPSSASRQGAIEVAGWQADRPYLDRLDKAGKEWEAALDKEMAKEGTLPLFWFDVAEWHWRAGRKEEARRAVEAALDLPTRDNQTLAIVASRLLRYGSHDRAIWLMERVVERETDRPQPMRTLALALIDRAKTASTPAAARADLQRAIELLAKVATGVFDVEAEGMETVALMEANAALARLKAMGGASSALDPRLVALLEADVRVVVEWNTPRTDLDLWITEPKGGKVGYSSPLSAWGGKMSGDVTNGYGPEEYLIRKANTGVYQVRANTFASDRTNPNGPSSLTIRLIRNFGRANQSEELIDLEMPADDRGEREIGRITVR